MGKASFEDVKAAEVLAEEIMHLARMMGLEQEHQYIAGHVDAIRSLYLQDDQEELDIDVSSLPDYVAEISGSIAKEKFASYDDYPQAASDNACKALRWIEEHGRDEVQAATRVGITRANQLCSRRPISEDTISRMAAFERHRRNAEIDPDLIGTPWKDKGYVSWLMWGGDEGVAWAQRKLNRIRQEQELAKMEFSVDEEQQIIVGPALIPNKEIYRVDEFGEPYYAFFSEDTIKKIAYKMLKDKKIDNLNLEHNDSDKVSGHLLESWIVEDPENDKQQFYGMNHPKGTWITMYKIDDEEAWQKVRNGEVTGLSIEAYLMDRLVKNI
jgi:hypothetical protein